MAVEEKDGFGRAVNGHSQTMVKAVTFDVGNTLLFVAPSVGAVYAQVAAGHGIEMEPEDADERFVAAWAETRMDHRGLIYGRTHEEAQQYWLRVVMKVFANEPGILRDPTAFMQDLYWRFRDPDVWHIHPSWEPVLSHFRQRGIRVGYISNWDQRLRELLDRLGLLDCVDSVIISAECGCEKPDAGIFERAVAELAVPASTVVHVGDTWQDDVLGPRRIGMRSVWFNPNGDPPPEPDAGVEQIRDLAELPRLIGLA